MIRRSKLAIVMLAGLLVGLPSVGLAQDDSLASKLSTPVGRKLSWAVEMTQPGAEIEPAIAFTPEFLEMIPADAIIEAVIEVMEESDGLELASLTEIGPNELRAAARARRDGAWWRIVINVEEEPPHGITRLSYNPAPELGAPDLADWAAFDVLLGELPGVVAFAVYELDDGSMRPLLLHNAERPVAIASAFKLWVLGALSRLVEEGGAAWDEPLAIREEWKSLPSGRMQNLAAGETRALSDYATLMISISDNTATDHLIHRIGREEVEAYAEEHGSPAGRNRPFLTTREFFKLKIVASDDLRGRYVEAGSDERRVLLEGPVAGLALPPDAEESDQPVAIDEIEWFASVSELARLIVTLVERGAQPGQEAVWQALTQNRGFNWDRNRWPRIAYKGGLEAGVVNLTWLMERDDGRRFVMSFGINDAQAAPDRTQIIVAAAAAGRLLERER